MYFVYIYVAIICLIVETPYYVVTSGYSKTVIGKQITLVGLFLVASSVATTSLVAFDWLDDNLIEYEIIDHLLLKPVIVKRDADAPHAHKQQLSFNALGREFNLFLQRKQVNRNVNIYAVNSKDEKRLLDLDIQLFEGYDLAEPDGSSVSLVWEDSESLTAVIKTRNATYTIEPSWRFLENSSSTTFLAYDNAKLKKQPMDGFSYCASSEEDEVVDVNETLSESDSTDFRSPMRSRRSLRSSTCQMLVVADYRFFSQMGQENFVKTSSYLFGLIDRIDTTFRGTTFGQFSGMGLEIKEMLIHESPTSMEGHFRHYNEYTTAMWDKTDLLEAFSHKDYRRFCLAHLFTSQSFSDYTLGASHLAKASRRSPGGICAGLYPSGGRTLSLNTGFSTSLDYHNKAILTKQADIVTTHGHSWGSSHDPDTLECSPDSTRGGKYIMYTFALAGYEENNQLFSPCSKRAIERVLRVQYQMGCFQDQSPAFCGNSRVEENEDCDSGRLDDRDPCCTNDCRLRISAVCSDRNDFCCDDCQYAAQSKVCRDELGSGTTCDARATCTGYTSTCPTHYKPNGTSCIERGQCQSGICVPFCETHGLVSCICENADDACKWCCKPSHNSTCEPYLENGLSTNQREGMPCFYGFCNKQGVCEKQVADLVQRLWQIIEVIASNSIVDFMKANLVGTVVILSLLVWVPASLVVSHIDRKRRRAEEKRSRWRNKRNNALIFKDHYDKSSRSLRRSMGAEIRNLINENASYEELSASDAEPNESYDGINSLYMDQNRPDVEPNGLVGSPGNPFLDPNSPLNNAVNLSDLNHNVGYDVPDSYVQSDTLDELDCGPFDVGPLPVRGGSHTDDDMSAAALLNTS